MSNPKIVLPTTRLGKIALVCLLVALVLVVISMTTAFIAFSGGGTTVPGLLSWAAPGFLLCTFIGTILSWVAIWRKRERSVLLLIVTIIATAGILLAIVGETIEAITMLQ